MPTGSHPAARRIFGAPLRYVQGPGALSETGPMAAALGPHALLVGDAFVLDMVGPAVTGSCQPAGVQVTPLLFAGEITPAEIERLVAAARVLPAGGALHCDSRRIQPGDGFIAWPGAATDGRQHMASAFARGASACLMQAEGSAPWQGLQPAERLAALPDLATRQFHRFKARPSRPSPSEYYILCIIMHNI